MPKRFRVIVTGGACVVRERAAGPAGRSTGMACQGLCSCLSDLGDDAVALCAGHEQLLHRLVQLLEDGGAECKRQGGANSTLGIEAPKEWKGEGVQSSEGNSSGSSSGSATLSGSSSDGAGEGAGEESDGGADDGRGATSGGGGSGGSGLSAALVLLACRRMAATRVGRQALLRAGAAAVLLSSFTRELRGALPPSHGAAPGATAAAAAGDGADDTCGRSRPIGRVARCGAVGGAIPVESEGGDPRSAKRRRLAPGSPGCGARAGAGSGQAQGEGEGEVSCEGMEDRLALLRELLEEAVEAAEGAGLDGGGAAAVGEVAEREARDHPRAEAAAAAAAQLLGRQECQGVCAGAARGAGAGRGGAVGGACGGGSGPCPAASRVQPVEACGGRAQLLHVLAALQQAWHACRTSPTARVRLRMLVCGSRGGTLTGQLAGQREDQEQGPVLGAPRGVAASRGQPLHQVHEESGEAEGHGAMCVLAHLIMHLQLLLCLYPQPHADKQPPAPAPPQPQPPPPLQVPLRHWLGLMRDRWEARPTLLPVPLNPTTATVTNKAHGAVGAGGIPLTLRSFLHTLLPACCHCPLMDAWERHAAPYVRHAGRGAVMPYMVMRWDVDLVRGEERFAVGGSGGGALRGAVPSVARSGADGGRRVIGPLDAPDARQEAQQQQQQQGHGRRQVEADGGDGGAAAKPPATDAVSAADCEAALACGFTVVLRAAGARSGRLGRAQDQLEALFGLPVGANVYCTPPGCPGLSAHYDDHCVLVLQLAGSKAWLLQPPLPHPAALLPLTYCPRLQLQPLAPPEPAHNGIAAATAGCATYGTQGRQHQEQEKEQDQGAQDGVVRLVLRAGDLLYVPRGWGHQAAALRPGEGEAGEVEDEAGEEQERGEGRTTHGRTRGSEQGAGDSSDGSGGHNGPVGVSGALTEAAEAALAAEAAGRAATEAGQGPSPGPELGRGVAVGCSLHVTFGLEVEALFTGQAVAHCALALAAAAVANTQQAEAEGRGCGRRQGAEQHIGAGRVESPVLAEQGEEQDWERELDQPRGANGAPERAVAHRLHAWLVRTSFGVTSGPLLALRKACPLTALLPALDSPCPAAAAAPISEASARMPRSALPATSHQPSERSPAPERRWPSPPPSPDAPLPTGPGLLDSPCAAAATAVSAALLHNVWRCLGGPSPQGGEHASGGADASEPGARRVVEAGMRLMQLLAREYDRHVEGTAEVTAEAAATAGAAPPAGAVEEAPPSAGPYDLPYWLQYTERLLQAADAARGVGLGSAGLAQAGCAAAGWGGGAWPGGGAGTQDAQAAAGAEALAQHDALGARGAHAATGAHRGVGEARVLLAAAAQREVVAAAVGLCQADQAACLRARRLARQALLALHEGAEVGDEGGNQQ